MAVIGNSSTTTVVVNIDPSTGFKISSASVTISHQDAIRVVMIISLCIGIPFVLLGAHLLTRRLLRRRRARAEKEAASLLAFAAKPGLAPKTSESHLEKWGSSAFVEYPIPAYTEQTAGARRWSRWWTELPKKARKSTMFVKPQEVSAA